MNYINEARKIITDCYAALKPSEQLRREAAEEQRQGHITEGYARELTKGADAEGACPSGMSAALAASVYCWASPASFSPAAWRSCKASASAPLRGCVLEHDRPRCRTVGHTVRAAR